MNTQATRDEREVVLTPGSASNLIRTETPASLQRSRCTKTFVMAALVVAASAAARGPAQATPNFTEVSSEVGVSVETNSYWGAGITFLDCDLDDDLDIHVVDGEGDPNVLFRNNGDRTFTEIAASVGLDDDSWGKAVVPADIDNDGDPDMLLTTYGSSEINRLFRNDGGTFVDISAGSGFDYMDFCTGAAWADYDGDGLLDCYITCYLGKPNRLMRNLGGGIFTDVAPGLGVADQTGWGYQPAWFDYDFDGDQDLYVGNDDFFGGTANVLFRNNGDGTFTDVSAQTGAGISIATMGIAVGDYDNDGDLDLYLSNLPAGNKMLRNDGGTFTEVAADLGVEVGNICWGVDFFDADNDGWLDLYVDTSDTDGNPHDFQGDPPVDDLRDLVQSRGGGGAPNRMFQNVGGTFTDVSAASGTDHPGVGYCSAVGDYDDDGDLDLYITNLWFTNGDAPSAFYENEHYGRSDTGTGFLRVNLEGTTSNRDAVGAKVWIRAGSMWQLREKQAGTGYLSSSEPTMHFGLGAETLVEELYVLWPSGLGELYTNIAAGTTLDLVEGNGTTTSVDDPVLSGPTVAVQPQPVLDDCQISFRLGDDAALSGFAPQVGVFDVTGRLVRDLSAAVRIDNGIGSAQWDRRDESGRRLPAGSYVIRFRAAGTTASERVVVLD